MTDKDRNPDDLLDFHYDHPVPTKDEQKEINELKGLRDSSQPKKSRGLGDTFDSYDELRRYEELRGHSTDRAGSSVVNKTETPARPAAAAASDHKASFSFKDDVSNDFEIEPPLSHRSAPVRESSYSEYLDDDDDIFKEFDRMHDEEVGYPEEAPEEPMASPGQAIKDIEAVKQASQEAYDRYRSNYTKKQKKQAVRNRVTVFDKILTVIYVVALAAFALSITIMDVLPFDMMMILFGVLALLTIIILIQTRRKGVGKWGKGLATFLAIILVVFYGLGTAYSLDTLSFLSSTSVENSSAVSNVTKDPFNVVITGIDVKGTVDEEGRSDVNMIVTVNPESSQVLLTSIPRDYEIYMPDKDGAMDKLTHTGFYGVETTILAEQDLLDITANYYVKVNFTTVEKFIDAIGGVDVYSEYEFTPVKLKEWTVQEGMNHMNGKQALAFARERKAFLTGDNQRIKNQQAVFEAMLKKATSSRTMVFSYNKILNELKDYFEMSFSSRELRSLAKMQLAKDPDWKIFKNTIVGGDGSLPTYSTGDAYAYVMTQDSASIENAKTLINAVLDGQILEKDEDDVVRVAGTSEE